MSKDYVFEMSNEEEEQGNARSITRIKDGDNTYYEVTDGFGNQLYTADTRKQAQQWARSN